MKIPSIDFNHATQSADCRITTTVAAIAYRRTQSLPLAALPSDAQPVVASLLAFLASHLPSGYQPETSSLSRIAGGIPATYSERPDDAPDDWEPEMLTPAQDDIRGAIYGSHPQHGLHTIDQGQIALPNALRIPLLAVWDGVETQLQAT